MSYKKFISLLFAIFLVSSCSSFIKEEEMATLKGYENSTYTLMKDAGEGQHLLKKGEKVKIHIVTSDESIKVYCYPKDVSFLKSKRILTLYLFDADFEKKIFDNNIFQKHLFSVVHPDE